MKQVLLIPLFAAIAFLLLCGCVQPVPPAPQPGETCREFCEGQPHIQCVGEWKISGIFPDDCNCFFQCEAAPQKQCAEEGEQYSVVYATEYPEKCCEGLTEWASGMDSRLSIADQCYETGLLKGSPVGTCINCGNGQCEANEQPCNCPQDCNGMGKSDYNSTVEFCASAFSKTLSQECSAGMELPLCNVCGNEPALVPPSKPLGCSNYAYGNCPEGCVKKLGPDSVQCPPGESVICTVDFDVTGSCIEPEG